MKNKILYGALALLTYGELKTQPSNMNTLDLLPKEPQYDLPTVKDSLHTVIIKDISIFPREFKKRYYYTLKNKTDVYDDYNNIIDTIPQGISLRQNWIHNTKKKLGYKYINIGKTKGWIAEKDIGPYNPLENITETFIVINRENRELAVYKGFGTILIKKIPISIGLPANGIEDKQVQGDNLTPEGRYHIINKNPISKFGIDETTGKKLGSLHISYPNIQDAREGVQNNTILYKTYKNIYDANNMNMLTPQETRLGGEIFIHGGGTGEDRTWGCIALDDINMKRLYNLIQRNTDIIIY